MYDVYFKNDIDRKLSEREKHAHAVFDGVLRRPSKSGESFRSSTPGEKEIQRKSTQDGSISFVRWRADQTAAWNAHHCKFDVMSRRLEMNGSPDRPPSMWHVSSFQCTVVKYSTCAKIIMARMAVSVPATNLR